MKFNLFVIYVHKLFVDNVPIDIGNVNHLWQVVSTSPETVRLAIGNVQNLIINTVRK